MVGGTNCVADLSMADSRFCIAAAIKAEICVGSDVCLAIANAATMAAHIQKRTSIEMPYPAH